jgi:hypothetical protein
MKSKFADLLRLIYTSGYFDHPKILENQNNHRIDGFEDDCFFFQHNYPENSSFSSIMNDGEATMVTEMIKYMLNNLIEVT